MNVKTPTGMLMYPSPRSTFRGKWLAPLATPCSASPPPLPPSRRRTRHLQGRPQGRGGHRAQGGEILLFQYRRGFRAGDPREETAIRPERPGLKVAEILADAGDTVTAGQTLARLTLPEGGVAQVQAPVAGLIASSTAVIGGTASGRGEALFSIIARSEFRPGRHGADPIRVKLAVNQTARIKIIGAGEVDGKVRPGGVHVEPNSQLGQVFITVTTTRKLLANSSARALIKTGQSCGVAVR